MTFPSHRQLYTSLIDAIARPHKHTSQREDATLSSPSLFSKNRRLLLTLHVLFPNLVLPALDLLDRELITRFVGSGYRCGDARSAMEMGGGVSDEHESRREDLNTPLYIVKSTMTHRRRDTSLAPRYVVHTRAWNCSCPSFALDVHHQLHARPNPAAGETYPEGNRDEVTDRLDFGGLSQDAGSWGDVPCCKHLLACFLVERGEGMLDGCVETVAATKEEMAGIVGGL